MSLDGAHHDNEPTVYDESAFEDYVGTPWLTGVIFFGAVPHGYAHAFSLSVMALGLLLLAVAGLSRLLPGPAAREQEYSRS